ncbi:MAG: alpha-amylase family glycosyl hydrolase [Sediminibacterium sp.]|nr:alpha-amylase family glycosyl hydrolase [Sediminibacterium sp.]
MKIHPKTWFLSLIFFSIISIINAQKSNSEQPITKKVVPWANKMNVYEVNIRQYTPAGTFKAFQEYLPRLRDMGVKVLWFMPINPISKRDRKGSLGSYYAIENYRTINPEFGTMADWINLVNACHQLGFKVLMDWVPSHTGADHNWLFKHKNFYVLDKKGNPTYLYDWKDTRKLNYENKELCDSMFALMKYWIKYTNIDGYRVDVAGEVPDDFWQKTIPALQKVKPIFMIAEAEKPSMYELGFDATYSWKEYHFMEKIALQSKKKKYNAKKFFKILKKINSTFPTNYRRMYFTSNHDENSWHGADFSTMPGSSHAPFAVLTQTLPNGFPLIYSGQEIPVKRSIKFFDKDDIFTNPNIDYSELQRFNFYQTLLSLRNDSCFSDAATFTKLNIKNKHILAFLKTNKNFNCLVIVNLSEDDQIFTFKEKFDEILMYDVFEDKQVSIEREFSIGGWGYKVYKF